MRRAALVRRGMPSCGGGSEIRRAARGWVVFAEAVALLNWRDVGVSFKVCAVLPLKNDCVDCGLVVGGEIDAVA